MIFFFFTVFIVEDIMEKVLLFLVEGKVDWDTVGMCQRPSLAYSLTPQDLLGIRVKQHAGICR